MKNVTKLFAFALATIPTAGPLFANTTEVKAPVNHLTIIEEEVEREVLDVFFTIEETVRYTKLETVGVEPDSAEVIEEVLADVQFNQEEIDRYNTNQITLLTTGLSPVDEELEAGVNDVHFAEAEKKN